MAKRYLLDTNVLSELVRNPAELRQKIATVDPSNVCTSIVVACELRFGAAKKASEILSERVERLLSVLDVMPLDGKVDRVYVDIRHRLEAKGLPIGGNDYLIAAHAVEQDCVLVTRNQREFRRVPGLATENWLVRNR